LVKSGNDDTHYVILTTLLLYFLSLRFKYFPQQLLLALCPFLKDEESRDSSVSIATGCELNCQGLIPGRGMRFSLLHNDHIGYEAHPASFPMRAGALYPEVKRPGPEADHTHLVPRSRIAEVYLHSPYVFMARCLIN
jgi:hypothetical protein